MRKFIFIILILCLPNACNTFKKNIDTSNFKVLYEYRDSIFKAVAYKDTINYSRSSDTLAFIFKFEIIHKNYSALYNWDRPYLGIYDEKDSLYIAGDFSLIMSDLDYILGFNEMSNSEVLFYSLFLTKNEFKEEINIKGNFNDSKYDNIKVNFVINFYFIVNKNKVYGKHNQAEMETIPDEKDLYYYISSLPLPNKLNFKFSTIENLHE